MLVLFWGLTLFIVSVIGVFNTQLENNGLMAFYLTFLLLTQLIFTFYLSLNRNEAFTTLKKLLGVIDL
uniref:Uncharacterized protein n=1 Tax=Megaselia scalaris TaxID=36166 RepID=T1GZM3_MEGSC